ncbi:pH regulation protein F [Pseudomonas sp. gcc21]|uniref:monovalent cation/H+ antiporter complex subunit F n=1 Tax=Pseudomonas sp. gcc21 TaxID=2726989 RepID=UPI0014512134|nr:monovalent cation/H+ antiporter complex subunit F [Pseudomonas sp. gcc21]QJD58881.1 pH regulation protein F [Pseudomonas sp. gcc21]
MTTELYGASWVLPLAGSILLLSALILVLRLLLGPSRPDRAVAVDAMTMVGVASVAVMALYRGDAELLDVAVVLAIVSFFSSVAFALLFSAGGRGASNHPTHDERADR